MAITERTNDALTGLCDVHTHILPGIDDGCRTPEDSLKILAQAKRQGIDKVFLTPHYYSEESVPDFLDKRAAACRRLASAADKEPGKYPALELGAEVAYNRSLLANDRLTDLHLGPGGFILLEMPFRDWNESIIKDVDLLSRSFGLTPVIAHIERYLNFSNLSQVRELMSLDVLIQMNASFVLSRSTSRRAKRLISSGKVDLLGSDCHNLTSRPENLPVAADQIAQWGLSDRLREISELSYSLFGE